MRDDGMIIWHVPSYAMGVVLVYMKWQGEEADLKPLVFGWISLLASYQCEIGMIHLSRVKLGRISCCLGLAGLVSHLVPAGNYIGYIYMHAYNVIKAVLWCEYYD